MNEFIEKNKTTLIVVAVILVLAAVAMTMGGSTPTTAGGNAKVDNSKEVKSNVGDSTIGGDRVNLSGITAGGNFELDMSNKSN